MGGAVRQGGNSDNNNNINNNHNNNNNDNNNNNNNNNSSRYSSNIPPPPHTHTGPVAGHFLRLVFPTGHPRRPGPLHGGQLRKKGVVVVEVREVVVREVVVVVGE